MYGLPALVRGSNDPLQFETSMYGASTSSYCHESSANSGTDI